MPQLIQQGDAPVPATVEENSRDPSTIDEDAALLVRTNLLRRISEMKLKRARLTDSHRKPWVTNRYTTTQCKDEDEWGFNEFCRSCIDHILF